MADAFDLNGILDMDASDFEGGADSAASASDDVTAATGDMSDSLFDVEPAGVAAGGALAGLGTAAQSVLDETQSLRESLGRTSVSMGISSGEANELARSMSDATFPLEDVTATMDSLAQQGVETEEEMQRLAEASDDLADATGTSAESVANELGPAIRGLDGDLDGLEENADAFTLAVRNTSLETSDLASTMERSSEELQEMGLQSDEAAGLIAAYGEETGKSGQQLRRDFSAALRDADGDMEAFAEETGIGESELEAFNDEVANSEGVTDDYADAANESVTTMDRLNSRFEDARLAASDYLGPISAIAPAAQAAGIGLIAMSTINVSAVAPSFSTVSAAALPVTAAVLGIAAAVTAAAVIWERDIGGIQGKTETAVAVIGDALGQLVEFVTSAIETASFILFEWSPGDAMSQAKASIMAPINDVRSALPGTLDEATDLAMDVFTTWHPAGIIWDKREEIMDALPSASDWRERGEDLVSAFTGAIRDAIPDVEGAVEAMGDAADEYLPSSDAERGAFSRLTDAGAAIPATIGGAAVDNSDELQMSMGETTEAATNTTGSPGAGGSSAGQLRQALEGMSLELSGELDVSGDVATIDDVDAKIRQAGRRAENRGIR